MMLAHRCMLRGRLLLAAQRFSGVRQSRATSTASLQILPRPFHSTLGRAAALRCRFAIVAATRQSNGAPADGNGASANGAPLDLAAAADWQQQASASAVDAADLSRLVDRNLARKYGLSEDMLRNVMDMPHSQAQTMEQLVQRVRSLGEWKAHLQRGVLPDPGEIPWPAEPLSSTLANVLSDLEMPRFCRRFPTLLNTVLNQMVGLIRQFEDEMAALKDEAAQDQQDQQQGEDQDQQQDQQPGSDGAPQESSADGDPTDEQPEGQGGEQGQEGEQGQGGKQGQGGEQQGELQVGLSSQEQQQQAPQQLSEQQKEELAEKLKAKAEELVEQFKDEWQPVAENLDRAMKAFDDLDGLMDKQGFDLSQGIWQDSGWQEVEDLRRKLEALKELRELVRSLGRAGGKGPLRRAPEEVMASKRTRGVIRSPLQPEETRGLARSGDLSRMLPFEAHLMVAGKRKDDGGEEKTRAAKAAHRLHMVRRAERNLMSYERTGWVEDEPAKLTGRFEIRPAAEQGPIIVCLDTSGSMAGSREVVAKAAALECMRSAHRHGRKCYLYAFSGPSQVKELELAVDARSMSNLLEFLKYSFGGGTDVDRPLELSLQRLEAQGWQQADILMVTDGEICPPDDDIMQRLAHAHEEMGLEVHGLLVGRDDGGSQAIKDICTHVHQFESWTAVGGRDMYY